MQIKSDERLNSELKQQVRKVRSSIAKNTKAESFRFTAKPSADFAGMIITDTTTGKTAAVSLYAYSNVMAVLKELFE